MITITKTNIWSIARFGLVGLAAVVAIITLAQIKPSNAAPYLGCSPHGYIFNYQLSTDTDVQAVDMVTGFGSSAGSITSRHFNAVGHNVKNNYFYGWDLSGSGTYMRIKADLTQPPEPLSITNYTGPTTNIFAGDVDEEGYHWFFTVGGANTTWWRIDLNTPNPTFVETGSTANPVGSEGTDWAYMPGTDNLYRGMDNGTNITIVAFSRTSKLYSPVGVVSNITAAADRNMGAVYADPDGNLYMSSHASGKLWRVDLSGSAPFTAIELGAADPNSNDGARCALATVPVDFGDAPAGYGTSIADDGPRHSIANFNIFGSNASLMLGQKIDVEQDGFPSASATGDDADHQGIPGELAIDDERGVTHIVATPNNTDPLTVPAYVVNATSQAATLVGWIDLDNDGAFEVGERVSASIPAGFHGYQQLTFPAPPAPYTVNTFARFRLFAASDTSPAAANLLPTGPAASGEVEDVMVQVGTYDVNKTSNPAEDGTVDSGATVTYTLTIQNTGSAPLTDLKVDDDLSDVLDDATIEGAPTVSPVSAGTATVSGNTLEFSGDVGIGQTITVTYAVKIKDAGSLGNTALNNSVLAAHSTSCHPAISGGSATVSDPDCKTSHAVNGLANTGSNLILPLLLSGSLLLAAGATWHIGRKTRLVSINQK